MKTYAVAFMSFFDNELTTEFIKAGSPAEAALLRMKTAGWEIDENFDCLQAVKRFAFDGDCMVDAVELPSAV